MATTKTTTDNETNDDICRILVLASHRARLERVFAILAEISTNHQETEPTSRREFLAAVATFDSYKDDESGKTVRYLLKIDYFPTTADGTNSLEPTPTSLLPFFDQVRPDDGNQKEGDEQEDDSFRGITTAIVASGLDGKQDAEKIQAFLDTLSPLRRIPVEVVQPGPDFDTLTDELAAFKALDATAKAEATRNRTMGPGKVAQFAWDTATRIIDDRQAKRQAAMDATDKASTTHQETPESEQPPEPHFIDSDKKRFSCRKCRTVLFGQDDLEDPPHEPARHNFGYRKAGHHGGGASSSECQSIFLASVPPFITADLSANEGKIACPKCDTKVGHWNWSGAQCSCGTWVCPAIQVPRSRVDEVLPQAGANALPTGAVVSPAIAAVLLQSQQQHGDSG